MLLQSLPIRFPALVLGAALAAGPALAGAGTLTPVDSTDAPVRIHDHHVRVMLNNGFARTEVTQTFHNPNHRDVEGVYSFPVPKAASLSEVTLWVGERELRGEIVEREKGRTIYEQERDQGLDAGLTTREGYRAFESRVARIPAAGEARIQLVYYQPLEVDTGVGRYLYPLEEGGTDEVAASFWTMNTAVDGSLSIEVELRSAYPVDEVRAPGFEGQAVVEQLEPGHHRLRLDLEQASLESDFVFYYALAQGLPGRLDVLPYRRAASERGTFMMVLTPGVDLAPITGGADYTFVLDASGSMRGKIATLADGVGRALGELDGEDRFRIVVFRNRARRLTRGWVAATPDAVARAIEDVKGLTADKSTNLYAGLRLGLEDLDADRVSNVILVTDAVTNTGIVEPRRFHELLSDVDVRLYGLLLGNGANWPLMETVCEASDGFYAQVSNRDDLYGQILLAKSKVTYEALHDVKLEIDGVDVSETTDPALGKIHRGEQIVFFGRYDGSGPARVRLLARKSGEDKRYQTEVEFPEVALHHPELERLWALHRIEAAQRLARAGLLPAEEVDSIELDLGLEYQLVTDQTAMLVLTDEAFEQHGIERRNLARAGTEREAQTRRWAQPVASYRADSQRPMFDAPAPNARDGVGAVDPILGGAAVALVLWELRRRRRSHDSRGGRS